MPIKRFPASAFSLFLMALSCADGTPDYGDRDFREDMRNLVAMIGSRAREQRPAFLVIPQNGVELLSLGDDASGPLAGAYLAAIDGVGQEDLRYGYDGDDIPTAADTTAYLEGYLDLARSNGIRVMVTDYCSTPAHVTDSFQKNDEKGYLGFAADSRDLDRLPLSLPPVFHAHDGAVTNLSDASNFCYLINPSAFADRAAFVAALDATSHDVFIIDLFVGDQSLTEADVFALATKPSGARRLVICYMSIGEAENYRYYWQPAWETTPPAWLDAENPDWEGNFKVRYWEPAWQAILTGDGDSYLGRILAAGFDGVYLDIIDAFEYYEARSRQTRKI